MRGGFQTHTLGSPEDVECRYAMEFGKNKSYDKDLFLTYCGRRVLDKMEIPQGVEAKIERVYFDDVDRVYKMQYYFE